MGQLQIPYFRALLGPSAGLFTAILGAVFAVELQALFQSLYRCGPGMIDDGELAGDLFQVPDKWWGFEAFGRSDHPGACVGYVPPGYNVTMLKGTDPRSARYDDVHVLVVNDSTNGLLKPTSFAIKPRPFSARRMACLADERIGQLSTTDLARLRHELVRLFGAGDENHG
jgi:hypothetical protein